MDRKEQHTIFETIEYQSNDSAFNEVERVLAEVLYSLKEKGYNPLNQLVGYIISGDPTYITSHKNARSLIMKFERDELLEEIVKFYLKNNPILNK